MVLKMLAPPQDVVAPGVHPSAVIGEGAVVEGTAIGPNVFVGRDAEIGAGTTLYPGVFVGRGTKVGLDCVLWPNLLLCPDDSISVSLELQWIYRTQLQKKFNKAVIVSHDLDVPPRPNATVVLTFRAYLQRTVEVLGQVHMTTPLALVPCVWWNLQTLPLRLASFTVFAKPRHPSMSLPFGEMSAENPANRNVRRSPPLGRFASPVVLRH